MTDYDYDVFLSFSSRDEDFVRPIWQKMSKSGLRVFWSNKSLEKRIGESFFSVIQEALSVSEHFMLICTSNTWSSKWVREEYETFFSSYYIPSDRKRKLIILETDQCASSDIPPFLKNIQKTDDVSIVIEVVGDPGLGLADVTLDELDLTELDDGEETSGLDLSALDFDDNADEMETMLDLAKAYLDMADNSSAIGPLKDVAANGSPTQQTEASKLLKKITDGG